MAIENINFKIVSIELVSKALTPFDFNDFKGEAYAFDLNCTIHIIKDVKQVIQFISINVRENGKEKILATFGISCGFEVQEFDETIKLHENGSLEINTDLDLFTKSAAISTSRGIIWSELRGTYLHRAVLPIIDVTTMTLVNKKDI